jgi:hypothetical protein
MTERIKALAAYLDVEEDTLKEGYDDMVVETEDGEEYLVCDEDEAREKAEESIRNFIDECGIEGFTKGFQDWIVDNAVESDWFEDAMREGNEFYFDDILEEGSDEFESRAVEELYERGLIDDEDFDEDEDGNVDHSQFRGDPRDYKDAFVDDMCEGWDDPIQWFRDNFGEEQFTEVVTKHNLIDIDAVVDTAIEWDGIAHFIATYDGDEIELDDGYCAYRLN